jgi:uncharacterized protein YqeY
LRSAIAAIDNAEAVDVQPATRAQPNSEHVAGASAGVGSSDVERRALSDEDMTAIVHEQVRERSQAADQYEQLGRTEVAERLRQEAAVLLTYVTADA